MFNIHLSAQDLDTIVEGLDLLSHGRVKELDVRIRIQAQDQIEAAQRVQAELLATEARAKADAEKAAKAAQKAVKAPKAPKAKAAAETPAAAPDSGPAAGDDILG